MLSIGQSWKKAGKESKKYQKVTEKSKIGLANMAAPIYFAGGNEDHRLLLHG